ncbi:MAG TPA: hypothetical protein PKX92_01365 [Edaphocola sp.]|nr:hypothetical protein [Edaphocola sp.]
MGCLRLDILEQSFVLMQIVYKRASALNAFYDAGGNKLREYITDSNSHKQIDYIGNIVFENKVIQYISTPSGRTTFKNNTPKKNIL